jgi:MFS family permease
MSHWRPIAGAVLLNLAVSPLFAWAVFTPVLSRELGVDQSALATVFSVGLAAFTVGVLVGGWLADRMAPRRLAAICLVGTVAGLAGSSIAMSVTTLALTFGITLGGITGVGYATAVRVAGTAASRRGLGLSLVVSAYAAGTVVLAPTVTVLLHAFSRTTTMLILAGLAGVLLAVSVYLLPPQVTGGDSAQVPLRRPGPMPRAKVVALWVIFCLGSASALAAFAQAGELVGDPRAASVAVAMLSAGNLAGRLVAGPLSDRIGISPALHGNVALLALACLLGATGTPVLVSLLLLGTQYGALSALVPAATASAVPAQRFGATYGLVFTGWGLAGLVAPIAAASAADSVSVNGLSRVALGVAVLTWTAVIGYGLTSRQAGRTPARDRRGPGRCR